MAKIVSDKSAGDPSAKSAGSRKSASSRVAAVRPSSAPKGAVATKPHGRTRTFFREVKIEMSKVTWPARRELLQATGVVIIAVIIAGVYIGVFDFIWNVIVRAVGLG
jgi:preprotein translocase subunit SecE